MEYLKGFLAADPTVDAVLVDDRNTSRGRAMHDLIQLAT